MYLLSRLIVLITVCLALATSGPAAPSEGGPAFAAQDTFRQYIDELKKNPANIALREKIITLALTMKPAPVIPEIAERHLSRGTAFMNEAAGAGGYNKAIVEFEAAANSAPWLAMAYFNLASVQEKVGFYTEAIQSLEFYLIAAPDATNSADVRKNIIALEADVQDLHASGDAAPPATEPVPDKAPIVVSKTIPAIEPGKKQITGETAPAETRSIAPIEKRPRILNFIGDWFYKETVHGAERTVQAFGISRNANGVMVPTPPERAAGYVPTIRAFDIADTRMKVEIHWKLTSVVGYWKIETYELTLSEDRTKLTGSYIEESVGGRNIRLDRTLSRQ